MLNLVDGCMLWYWWWTDGLISYLVSGGHSFSHSSLQESDKRQTRSPRIVRSIHRITRANDPRQRFDFSVVSFISSWRCFKPLSFWRFDYLAPAAMLRKLFFGNGKDTFYISPFYSHSTVLWIHRLFPHLSILNLFEFEIIGYSYFNKNINILLFGLSEHNYFEINVHSTSVV